jgi:hypothetical protein
MKEKQFSKDTNRVSDIMSVSDPSVNVPFGKEAVALKMILKERKPRKRFSPWGLRRYHSWTTEGSVKTYGSAYWLL